MTSTHDLSKKEENYLSSGLSTSDSNNTSENSTLVRENPKKNKNKNKNKNKKVYLKEIQIIYVESYKAYNQNNVCFQSLEDNTVKSCNCNLF